MLNSGRHVLIVEDDYATREMLAGLLSSQGFYAVGAEDGLEALHLLRTVRRRAPEASCLVLLDLAMPRFGGDEFRRAQLHDPCVAAVPVVVMSGATDLEQRAFAMDAVATIRKPINFDVLLNVVTRYCVPVPAALRPAPDRLPDRRGQDGSERSRGQHERRRRFVVDDERG
jgi:CheY-like chemotaxis protein